MAINIANGACKRTIYGGFICISRHNISCVPAYAMRWKIALQWWIIVGEYLVVVFEDAQHDGAMRERVERITVTLWWKIFIVLWVTIYIIGLWIIESIVWKFPQYAWNGYHLSIANYKLATVIVGKNKAQDCPSKPLKTQSHQTKLQLLFE